MASETPRDTRGRICVVVDTSVWRSEPLLKTPLGVTLTYTVHRRGGLIGLPEVVELELASQIIEAGLDARGKANAHLHMLETIADSPSLDGFLPDEDKLRQKVDTRISELEPLLVREPFTFEHAKAALIMVNSKLPPNGDKDQQFKDSAIWQAVLALSGRYSTAFITNDKAFFQNRDPKKGLARNLVNDCRKIGTNVEAFCSISEYLEALQHDEPNFDHDAAKDLIVPLALQRLTIEAESCGTVPTNLLTFSVSAFPTEIDDRLAIDYSVTFRLDCDRADKDKVFGIPEKGTVHGSAYLNRALGRLTDHYIQNISLRGRGSYQSCDFKDYKEAFVVARPLLRD